MYTEQQQADFIAVISETNGHLKALAENTKEIADTTNSIKKFCKGWLPLIVAGFSLAYPSLAKVIASLPPIQ